MIKTKVFYNKTPPIIDHGDFALITTIINVASNTQLKIKYNLCFAKGVLE